MVSITDIAGREGEAGTPPTDADELRERYAAGERRFAGARLDGANLTGIDLIGADLSGSQLSGAVLRGARLSAVDLSRATLIEADLHGADLSGVTVREVELRVADFGRSFGTGATRYQSTAYFRHGAMVTDDPSDDTFIPYGALLARANLLGADLSQARVAGVRLSDTILANVSLKEASGLETVEHEGPSVLDPRTFNRSAALPTAFLHGVGLLDWQIEEAKLLQSDLVPTEIAEILTRVHQLRADQPLQVRPVFISYSRADHDFVDVLEGELNAVGIRFWRDIHDLEAGPLEPQIRRGQDDRVALVVLSEASLASGWVESEVEYAQKAASADRPYTLCPIALDEAWKLSKWDPALRMALKKFHILDFSAWQDRKRMSEMFVKLERGLRKWYR